MTPNRQNKSTTNCW